MARTKDAIAAKRLGQSLERLHRKAGSASFSTIERHLVEVLGPSAPVGETLRGYHAGRVDPASVHIDVAVALANYYGVPVSTLHASFGPRYERGRVLLTSPPDGGSWVAGESNPEPAGSMLVSEVNTTKKVANSTHGAARSDVAA